MPSRDPLQPDPEAVEAWRKLRQGAPSPEALPPATGGLQWLKPLLIVLLMVGVILMVMMLQGRIQ
jgi:hypothetical protein